MADASRPPSDAALVERARRGEAEAFETLVRRHYRAAFSVALAFLGNRMDAEDVAQDAFVRALERLEECREPDRFASWLLQIVRYRAHNVRAYLRVRDGPPAEHATAAARTDVGRDAERAELRAILDEAIATLGERQREVLLLHDLEGWRHRDIAESLGISEVLSRQYLFTARRALRERLDPRLIKEYTRE